MLRKIGTKNDVVPETIYIGVHSNLAFFNVPGSNKEIKSVAASSLWGLKQVYKKFRMVSPLHRGLFSRFNSGEFHATFDQRIGGRMRRVGQQFIAVRNGPYQLTIQYRHPASPGSGKADLAKMITIMKLPR